MKTFEKRGKELQEKAKELGLEFTARIVVADNGIFAIPGLGDLWDNDKKNA